MDEKHLVHWFRKGLRLHDNPSLKRGLKNATTFRCIFILDPWFAGSSNVGINKWRFLLQCLEDLDRNLRKLNSRLFVIRGQPADILPKLLKEWATTCLTFEEDPEPFGRVRDQNIIALCRSMNITVYTEVAHTLYKLESIIEKNNGKAPLTYHQFQGIISSMDPPPLPESPVSLSTISNVKSIIGDDHDDKYGVPTLEELGFDMEGMRPGVWIGGESEALSRLERHLERKAWVASFGRPKMTPQSLLASQTGLSPYLRFGCLSTRLFYYQLNDLYRKIKRAVPPLSLHGQILWREFFYCAATRNPNFDRMIGNPICVQVPWDKNPEALAKWANGQTGFPWIDAIMTQLREEGWIHHLARHAVACFLTRGDLWISWEEGMKVFDELLLDADWSVNAGMWMWLSCSSFFQQFFHCYCPVRFGRKADPNGDYIRFMYKYLRPTFNREAVPITEQFRFYILELSAGQGKTSILPSIHTSTVANKVRTYCVANDRLDSRSVTADRDYMFFQILFADISEMEELLAREFYRRYLPVLKNMPTKYIHEPWNCPESVQKAAKCIIGVDYAVPMLNHSIVAKHNIERMRQVYHQLIKYKGSGGMIASPLMLPEKNKDKDENSYEDNSIFATPPAPSLKSNSNIR